jgi:hypothetical protein
VAHTIYGHIKEKGSAVMALEKAKKSILAVKASG